MLYLTRVYPRTLKSMVRSPMPPISVVFAIIPSFFLLTSSLNQFNFRQNLKKFSLRTSAHTSTCTGSFTELVHFFFVIPLNSFLLYLQLYHLSFLARLLHTGHQPEPNAQSFGNFFTFVAPINNANLFEWPNVQILIGYDIRHRFLQKDYLLQDFAIPNTHPPGVFGSCCCGTCCQLARSTSQRSSNGRCYALVLQSTIPTDLYKHWIADGYRWGCP